MSYKKVDITVATPTYNRSYCIEQVFQSLSKQTLKSFEWIVVDDGSTDNTKEVIEKLVVNSKFPIKYVSKINGGKHTAINQALRMADGELFLIFDSDDKCTDDSLEFMFSKWKEFSLKYDDLAGVTTLSKSPEGIIIGNKFPADGDVDHMFHYYQKNHIYGDKWDIHSTKILQQYPFPEIDEQKFCPESLIWNRISKNYKTAFFNKPTKIATYLEDGLSKNLVKLRMKYPKLNIIYYKELLDHKLPLKLKFRAAANYLRFSLHDGSFYRNFFKNPIFFMPASLLGILMYFVDRNFKLSRK